MDLLLRPRFVAVIVFPLLTHFAIGKRPSSRHELGISLGKGHRGQSTLGCGKHLAGMDLLLLPGFVAVILFPLFTRLTRGLLSYSE